MKRTGLNIYSSYNASKTQKYSKQAEYWKAGGQRHQKNPLRKPNQDREDWVQQLKHSKSCLNLDNLTIFYNAGLHFSTWTFLRSSIQLYIFDSIFVNHLSIFVYVKSILAQKSTVVGSILCHFVVKIVSYRYLESKCHCFFLIKS